MAAVSIDFGNDVKNSKPESDCSCTQSESDRMIGYVCYKLRTSGGFLSSQTSYLLCGTTGIAVQFLSWFPSLPPHVLCHFTLSPTQLITILH